MRCLWQGVAINCSSYFKPLETDQGLCFVFNSIYFSKIHGPLLTSFDYIPGGLSLILDTKPDDYFLGTSFMLGYNVVINDVAVFPVIDGKTVAVGPGQSVNIGLYKEVYTSLNPPYSKQECIVDAESEPRLFSFAVLEGFPYSKNSCYMSCFLETMENDCGCLYENESHENECSYAQYLQCFSSEEVISDMWNCFQSCKDTCRTVTFDTRVNMAAFPDPISIRLARTLQFPVTEEEEIRKRMLQLNVYYVTLDEKHVTQHPRYNSLDIFSTIGGLMGLCLGVSLISVLELCDFLLGCTMIPLARKPDIDSSTI